MPNTKNINRVIDFLKSEQENYHFDMDTWCDKVKDGEPILDYGESGKKLPENFCGTVACIGGTVDLLFKINPEDGFDDSAEAEILGITQLLAYSLFYRSMDYIKDDREKAIAALEFIRDEDPSPSEYMDWLFKTSLKT